MHDFCEYIFLVCNYNTDCPNCNKYPIKHPHTHIYTYTHTCTYTAIIVYTHAHTQMHVHIQILKQSLSS